MNRKQIDKLERVIGQLDGMHDEISVLSKKSPNDAVNSFKLKFINAVLLEANEFLGNDKRPAQEFTQFNLDDVPSNSDVTFILNLYMEALEKFRSDNIQEDFKGDWHYKGSEGIPTGPPFKLKKKT
jgi:hypothetical protein